MARRGVEATIAAGAVAIGMGGAADAARKPTGTEAAKVQKVSRGKKSLNKMPDGAEINFNRPMQEEFAAKDKEAEAEDYTIYVDKIDDLIRKFEIEDSVFDALPANISDKDKKDLVKWIGKVPDEHRLTEVYGPHPFLEGFYKQEKK